MVIKTAVLIAKKDMDFINAVKKLKAKNCIRVYGVIGGVTGYINHWNPKMDLKTNICGQICI